MKSQHLDASVGGSPETQSQPQTDEEGLQSLTLNKVFFMSEVAGI